ncbi:Ric [Bugula neritina]|uniref:small monomeric GTPase n=1 Tax=Bugula neritina TaxID=10212 RepID=A0A7J7JDJ8_BUGNE|nr:Ric [Bugula neritina]
MSASEDASKRERNTIPYKIVILGLTMYLVSLTVYLVSLTMYLVPLTVYLVSLTVYLVVLTVYLVSLTVYLVSPTMYLVSPTMYLVALTMQFVASTFMETHDPTIEDAYRQQCIVDDEVAHLDILDTAGQREFTAMKEQYMRSGEGFVICYSVTDRRSFNEIKEYNRLIKRVRCQDNIPIILVGNKVDLYDHRQVSTAEGQALATQYGCPFFESSAARRQYVDEIFHQIIREVRKFELARDSEVGKKHRSGFRQCLRQIRNWARPSSKQGKT